MGDIFIRINSEIASLREAIGKNEEFLISGHPLIS